MHYIHLSLLTHCLLVQIFVINFITTQFLSENLLHHNYIIEEHHVTS